MYFRDVLCNEVGQSHVGQSIKLCGWVAKSRDHGGVVFIDLFDYSGIVQLVFNPDCSGFNIAERLSTHSVLCIEGTVRPRPEGTVNPNLATGQIEIDVEKILWHNQAAALGFDVNDEKVGDDVRAQHRVLDLRSEKMQNSLRFRAKMIQKMRTFLEQENFLEVETPILTRATPEGARDYLVPSRNHPGSAFALPQSPQQYKQMLMMAGMDRYYQVARCFRDEDLRADRQPEFTQLDMEMSFMTADEICELIERMVHYLVEELKGQKLEPFLQMSYDDALTYYGTDAPNLCNPLKFTPMDDVFSDSDFGVFQSQAVKDGARVVALRVPQAVDKMTRRDLDRYTDLVSKLGAKGLAYIKVNDVTNIESGLNSPILKFLSKEHIEKMLKAVSAENGDMIFFGAGDNKLVNLTMHALSKQIAMDLELMQEGLNFVWVKAFPMFEKEDGRLMSVHHPFTAPVEEDENALDTAKAQAYDLVLNGHELGGGSIRISNPELQKRVFELLNIDAETAQEEFGHLLNALNQGCPIHGGVAFGIDRMCMVLLGTESIREVIAFPKTQTASCALTKAPGKASRQQLRELGLTLLKGD